MFKRNVAILHAHTNISDGTLSPKKLVEEVANKGVKFLAITDHDTMAGVGEAVKAGRKLGVEIIAGEEIQTSLPRGLHIVGLFLKKPIPHSKSIKWTVNEIHKQGGLAIIAHPMVRIFGLIPAPTGAVQLRDIKKLIKEIRFDGIEVSHPNLNAVDKKILEKFYAVNKSYLGAVIGASDSHFGGKDALSAFTKFIGNTKEDLYDSIKNRSTTAISGKVAEVSVSDKLIQFEQSFFRMGIRRYRKMIKRWLSLDFGSVAEQL